MAESGSPTVDDSGHLEPSSTKPKWKQYLDIAFSRHSQRDQPPAREEQGSDDGRADFVAWAMTRPLLQALFNNPGNGRSDYSYALSCIPTEPGVSGADTYPCAYFHPSAMIFVDQVGWVDNEEVSRYLMMGYRVWNSNGRRLHFFGRPVEYDSLRQPFRRLRRVICTQDPRLPPDLDVQINAVINCQPNANAAKDAHSWGMHWQIASFPITSSDPLHNVMIAWDISRFENARVTHFTPDILSKEASHSEQISTNLLKFRLTEMYDQSLASPYRLGIDTSVLHTRYPPTKVKLVDSTGHEIPSKPCVICTSFDFQDFFEWRLHDEEIVFGSLEKVFKSSQEGCSFCKVLALLCEDSLDLFKCSGHAPLTTYEDALRSNSIEPISVYLTRSPPLLLSTKPFVVLKQHGYNIGLPGPVVSYRTVSGDVVGNCTIKSSVMVEPQVLKEMVNECFSLHGTDCGRKDGISATTKIPVPVYFIDLTTMSLVKRSTSETYITLSYVWGKKKTLRTTKQIFDELRQPGGLTKLGVSQLIRDASSVCQMLGVRYLWVDALCIIQDDESHKLQQINVMSEIYGSAHLTIVALTGVDSASALPGISKPRPRWMELVQKMPFTGQLSGLVSTARGQVYEKRVWTFQERLISPRCLYFSERQVFFDCGKGTTSDHERILPEQDRGRYHHPFNTMSELLKHIGDHSPSSPTAPAPEPTCSMFSIALLDCFCQLMSEYTSRVLSFQSDIENAFVGIQDVLSSNLGWRFAACMPVGVFDWSLLWLLHGQLERRKCFRADGTEFTPPSWSWLGWQGRASYACYTYHGKPLLQNLRSHVDSFTITTKKGLYHIQRQNSEIWSSEFNHTLGNVDSPAKLQMTGAKKQRISFEDIDFLEFEAEIMPALFDFSKAESPNCCWKPHTQTALGSSNQTFQIFESSPSLESASNLPDAEDLSDDENLRLGDRSRSKTPSERTQPSRSPSEDDPTSFIGPPASTSPPPAPEVLDHASTLEMIADPPRGRLLTESFDSSMTDQYDFYDRPRHPKWRFQFPFFINWLNTGSHLGSRRLGLRHGYEEFVLETARNCDESTLELLGMVECDVKLTIRGGQHSNEKLFEEKDKLVVMLVQWKGDYAERIAIGYCDIEKWNGIKTVKKHIRLR